MSADVNLVEFLGGPCDGGRYPVHDEEETIVIREGAVIHRYDASEVYEGPAIRRVFRWTAVIPMPTRKKP